MTDPIEHHRSQSFGFQTVESLNILVLQDYLQQELKEKERIITPDEHFVLLVPFWIVWLHQAMIIPRGHLQHIGQFYKEQKHTFANILKDLTQ